MKKTTLKTRGRHLLFLAYGTILLTGCVANYIPNVVNTPLLSGKGEVQIAAYTGFSGFDPQAAVAVTDHIGIMANGSFEDWKSSINDDFHKHQFVEIGSGYYTKFGGIGRFEAYGGYGHGILKARMDNDFWVSQADLQTNRFFIQPSVGLATAVVDASFANRIAIINLKQDSKSTTAVFYEPVATIKFGFTYFKFVTQAGFSLPANDHQMKFTYRPFIFSFGIQAFIGR